MRNDGFVTGLMAGMALGALMLVAMTPQLRGPAMEGAEEMGDRMRGMWKRGAHAVEATMAGDHG